ncbi:lipoprotein insertase outer membrane protein LolB [Vogesella sp. LIG4]|uniref:lipoprotein insertase outer membrane protein LolB n=1 Tax=Vogesella sp. LIG4 TaxID=1192162 RepID=UPI00082000B8|nr:lipoprotein insertase outer membrane protein LolB [Vogesella sp. LIG4]SCK09623.1 outer membrane lipoprotein LolB [Vogesella sp. LIG4]
MKLAHWLVSGCLLLLAACATTPEVSHSMSAPAANVVDSPFSTSGRLAVNYQGRGQLASFDWQHSAGSDQLNVKTPIGTTVASLRRDASGVRLLADGQERRATDVESLTEDTLGWPLPLSNLAWWARGLAAPGIQAEQAADGRLQQQGWLIRHSQDATTHLPRRLELEREGLSIRLVFSDWRGSDASSPLSTQP